MAFVQGVLLFEFY